MGYMKRAMALLLALVMSLCLVFSANAATSPTTAPTNPNFDPTTGQDTNTQDDATIVSTVVNNTAVVDSVTSTGGSSVSLTVAKDASNNEVPITQVGDGTKGAFDPTIKTVTVSSTAEQVTIAKNALSKAKVKKLNVNAASVSIKKNAFKGTKTKNPTIKITGVKKASDVKVVKGSFDGLNKKAQFVVSKKSMSKKQFNKLKKNLKKKGFKGKIVRK